MQVRLRKNLVGIGKVGDVVGVNDPRGVLWIKDGLAEPLTKIEKAERAVSEKPKKASKRGGK